MQISTLVLLAGLSAGLVMPATEAVAQAPSPTSTTRPNAIKKYLVYFRDKTGSPYTTAQPAAYLSARAIQRRTRQNIAVKTRDLPVNPTYVAQVKGVAGVTLWYTSRWLNAAIVSCDESVLPTLNALSSVRTTTVVNRTSSHLPEEEEPTNILPTGVPADYGNAYAQANQIGAVRMHDFGWRGEGIQIAVFDGGFPGVNTASPFASIFQEGRLASVFNFVDKNTNVYQRSSHGTNTLSTMGANQTGLFIGTAPKATYHLCITEDTSTEYPIEEANWLIAAEYADSAGVDVISSSLGYTTFDNTLYNHTYADMNGRTTLITQAAVVAARVGMIVCNSAGNDGAGAWRYIGAPADADSIISVGAVTAAGVRSSFSSYGPTADGRIKPDLAAQGTSSAVISQTGASTRSSGTSFSCPILAGMVAGFWQANPTLTNQQVISFLKRSGTQAANPDNSLGYGIPDFVRAYNLAHPDMPLGTGKATGLAALNVYPNPTHDSELSLQLPDDLRGTPLQVRFYDVRGALVAEQRLAPTSAASVALTPGTLKGGVYICTVQAGQTAPRTVRFVQL